MIDFSFLTRIKEHGRMRGATYEKITEELFSLLPDQQLQAVFSQSECDIEPEFMGFIDTYYHLSQMIPTDYTIVDLGCAYNPQCFFFAEHHRYIGVDVNPNTIYFKSDNCEIYTEGIEKFIQEESHKLNQGKTFAICNYVPNWYSANINLVKNTFQNLYTFYPCHL